MEKMGKLRARKYNWRHMMKISFMFYVVIVGANEGVVNKIDVLVNDTVSMHCYTKVSIDVQWHFNSISNYLYAGRRFYQQGDRLRMEKENGEAYVLVIPKVRSEDAGWYNCSEEISGRRISSTHLTVLYSDPVCFSNMQTAGFIGPNTCNLQQENMTFNCVVSFNGSFPPNLMWRLLNDNRTLNDSICEDKRNRRKCSLIMKSDPKYDGSILICQIAASKDSRFNCSTEAIKILHFSSTNDTAKKLVNDNVNCSTNSNLDVKYKWTVKQNNEVTVLSSKQNLVIQTPGIYNCEVNYSIRNYSCISGASVMNVSDEITISIGGTSGSTTLAIILSVVLGLLILSIGMVILIRKLIKWTRENRNRRNKVKPPQNYFGPDVDPQDVHEPLMKDITSTCTGSKMRLESSLVVFGARDAFKVNLNRTDKASSLHRSPFELRPFMATAVYRGSVFVIGIGEQRAEIWRFDAKHSKWNECASLVKGRLGSSVAFVDHILYICGGQGCNEDVFDDVEAYDAVDDKCVAVGKLTNAVHEAWNCAPYKASLYIFGGVYAGDVYVNTVQVYDTKLNSCTILRDPMPKPRYRLCFALHNNYAILLGAESCFIYNFDTETWSDRDQFRTRIYCFGMVVHKKKLFVFGGTDSNDTVREGIDIDDVNYVPISNILNDEPIEWKHHAYLPRPSRVRAYGTLDFLVKQKR